jgi:uncharacterized protein (UPF0332 family)
MNQEVQQRFEKAGECIDDAQLLLESKRFAATVNRAYYAMFHAAIAVLLTKNITRSSHSGIISAFGELFAATGIIDTVYHKYLREAFDLRQEGDYEAHIEISKVEAEKTLNRAVDFVDACRKLCDKEPSQDREHKG